MAKTTEILPDWISEETACAWLGISRHTLIRWRKDKGLHYTSVNKRTIMYDRGQLNNLLFSNSTYAASNYQLKKTA